MSDRNRERSLSVGAEDSDFDSQLGEPNQPGKPGRKKNPNSQAARRDQNRIAQREFRLRKQQRIRDLEARVELLSGTKDEALGEMRNILKGQTSVPSLLCQARAERIRTDLMTENQTLRNLLRNLASFIGDGAGGLLPKMGWNMQDFNHFINKGETDTAWEGYQRRKNNVQNQKKGEPAESSSSFGNKPMAQSQKRAAEVEINGSSAKKPRNDEKDFESSRNGYPPMLSMPASSLPIQPSLYSSGGPRPQQDQNGVFSDLMRNPNGSALYIPPNSNPSTQYANPGPSLEGYPRSYMSPVNMNMEQSTSSFYEPANSVTQNRLRQSNDTEVRDDVEDDDPKKSEAFKLINYHLDNYKRSPSYCLPASLRPTMVQRTMPHESVIDRVLLPELRDRMIMLRDRYELVDCLLDLKRSITIHDDDVLAHQNWELGEDFIRKYSFLVDAPLLKIVNRWRLERGDLEIVLSQGN